MPGAQPEHLHGPTLVRGDAAPLFLFGGTAEGPVVGCRERWAQAEPIGVCEDANLDLRREPRPPSLDDAQQRIERNLTP